jgi:hypothetical protein
MVIVMDFGADVQSYSARFDALLFPRPAVCPHCQASGTVIGHGFYERQPTDGEHDYRIQIKRWCCSCAGYTFDPPAFTSKNGLLGFVAGLDHDSMRTDAIVSGLGKESAAWAVGASSRGCLPL